MPFLLLLLAHFAADFMLQDTTMANMKLKSCRVFLKHCVIYAVVIAVVVSFYGTVLQIALFSLSIALSHFIVDAIRILIQKRPANTEKREFRLFVADQFIHIAILATASFLIPQKNFIGQFVDNTVYTYLNISLFPIMAITTAYAFCLQPAGVLIKKIFLRIGYQKPDNEDENKAGFLIGVLERVCILTLAILGQFSAISFVVAAKSLARIKQLEDKDFTEKYLVGTLLSVVIALICGIVVRRICSFS